MNLEFTSVKLAEQPSRRIPARLSSASYRCSATKSSGTTHYDCLMFSWAVVYFCHVFRFCLRVQNAVGETDTVLPLTHFWGTMLAVEYFQSKFQSGKAQVVAIGWQSS